MAARSWQGKLGSFRVIGSWGGWQYGKLGSFCKNSCWPLAVGCWPDEIGFVSYNRGGGVRQGGCGGKLGSFRIFAFWQIGGNADFGIPGSRRDAAVVLARFVTPPCFWCYFVLNCGGIIPCCLIFVKYKIKLTTDYTDFH